MHFIHDEDTDLVLVAEAGPRPRASAATAAHHNRVGDFIQPIDLVNEQFLTFPLTYQLHTTTITTTIVVTCLQIYYIERKKK